MSLDLIPFDSIIEDHLQALVENVVPEGRTLDYKRDPYGAADADKREFLADVSALANTAGGHLVIGMDEAAGVAKSLCGFGAIDPDKEATRLESIARDGLQPRLTGLQIKAVALSAGGHTLVVRVPKSLNAPHRVIASKSNRFYARAGGGKYEPDVDELREMFAMLPSLLDRLRAWHRGRLDAIIMNPARQLVSDSGLILFHVVPLSALGLGGHKVSAADISAHVDGLRPYRAVGLSWQVNFDGFLVWSEGYNGAVGYVQAYRNGIIEMIARGVVVHDSKSDENIIFSANFEAETVKSSLSYIKSQLGLGFKFPVAICITLNGVLGARVDRGFWHEVPVIKENTITFDEIILEDVPTDGKGMAQQLKPIFDQLANAGGRPKSTNFLADGEWQLEI